jgi:2'-5' RNA ligase
MVEEIWQNLERECGLERTAEVVFPHFSWHVAEEYDRPRLEETLWEIARTTRPFPLRTAGLGMFTGPRPAVYVPVVKTRRLMDLHSMIWDMLEQKASRISRLYAPGRWIPHISLARGNPAGGNMAGVLGVLGSQTFDWEFDADNVSFLSEETDGSYRLSLEAAFTG